MATDIDIDALLKQDAAADVVDSGDLTRAEFSKVFTLTKGERASLFPASPRRGVTPLSDGLDGSSNASDGQSD